MMHASMSKNKMNCFYLTPAPVRIMFGMERLEHLIRPFPSKFDDRRSLDSYKNYFRNFRVNHYALSLLYCSPAKIMGIRGGEPHIAENEDRVTLAYRSHSLQSPTWTAMEIMNHS